MGDGQLARPQAQQGLLDLGRRLQAFGSDSVLDLEAPEQLVQLAEDVIAEFRLGAREGEATREEEVLGGAVDPEAARDRSPVTRRSLDPGGPTGRN